MTVVVWLFGLVVGFLVGGLMVAKGARLNVSESRRRRIEAELLVLQMMTSLSDEDLKVLLDQMPPTVHERLNDLLEVPRDPLSERA